MNPVFAVLAFGLASAGAWSYPPAPNCAGLGDDYIELGCWGYHRCQGGRVTTLKCPGTQVLDRGSLTCVPQGNGNACGYAATCAGRQDGMYADPGCLTYFTCASGQFLGHDYCPKDLYFNQAQQFCDWPSNVPGCFSGNPGGVPAVTSAPIGILPTLRPTFGPVFTPAPTQGPVFTQAPVGTLPPAPTAAPGGPTRAPPAPSCVAHQDGYIELGCWGYHRCTQGRVSTLVCNPGEVLERDSLSCVRQGTGHTVCGTTVSCVGVPNGLYEDLAGNCESYFECFNGKFLGHNYCPGNLYFNQATGTCDYPQNVPHCFPGVTFTPAPVGK